MRSHKAKKSCDKAGNDKEYADYPLISPFHVAYKKRPPAAVFFSFN